jgi:hypothetical protein
VDNKISRASNLTHPGTRLRIDMPLLVPSFSSKGFQIRADGTSEVQDVLKVSEEFITESYLISAYDIYHKHVPQPRDLPFRPSVIVLDSGGYEISKDRDLADVTDPLPGKKKWNTEMLGSVLKAWPKEYATILVSYDHPEEHRPFEEQVEMARELFRGHHDHLHTFLLKPESKDQYTLKTALKNAVANIEELRSFNIIGLTQKELGYSLMEQMIQIARFRRELDVNRIAAPIHIFGSLDPLTVCLFFVAGAEIFDGLTWMRYAYRDGQCVYFDNAAVLGDLGLEFNHNYVRVHSMRDNIVTLQKLAAQIRDFQFTGEFAKLPHGKIIQSALDSLHAHLGKGGKQ